MSEYIGKTVLITGASEGIGRATAKAFAEKGAHLVLVARNEKRLQSLAEELIIYKTKIKIQQLDLRDISAIDNFFAQVESLDYAVNNAGVEGKIAEINALNVQDFNEIFDINVRAVFQCLQHEVDFFRKNDKPGTIVNISSIAGFKGIANSSLYVASKHAVLGLTRATAVEQIQHGIRVNCISPGATNTPMLKRVMGNRIDQFIQSQPTGQFISPENIAKGILWLCGSDAQNIVGQDIVIDGGKTVILP